MKKIPYVQEYAIAILTLIIGLLMTTNIFGFQRLEFSQTQIGVANIVAIILFIIICVLKNYDKVKLVAVSNRFNMQIFIITNTYLLSTIFLIVIFIINGTLVPFLGTIIIILEVFLLITNIYMKINKRLHRSILGLIIVKEFHFDILVFTLLLDGLPFSLINIPMIEILAITYIVLQVNIAYSYFKENN